MRKNYQNMVAVRLLMFSNVPYPSFVYSKTFTSGKTHLISWWECIFIENNKIMESVMAKNKSELSRKNFLQYRMFRIIGFCYINQYVSKATLIDLNIFLVNECILSWLWWLAITQIFNHHHRLNIFCWLVWLHQRLDTLDREPTPGFWLLADARFDCSNKMASFWDLNLNKKYRQMLCDTSKNSTKRRTRSSSYSIFGNRTTIFSIFKGIFTFLLFSRLGPERRTHE